MIRLTPEILLKAYARGIFPMAEDRNDPTLYWIDPETRGILPLDCFHVSKRLARIVRADTFEVTADRAFEQVIEGCAQPGPGRDNTWINDRIIELYKGLHRIGHAHSVECWREERLVGGLYGVALGAAFFGESMFSREANASKVALVHLAARLRRGGYRLLDTQFVTRHLARFGATEISRRVYLDLLENALASRADFYCLPASGVSGEAALQSITQTS